MTCLKRNPTWRKGPEKINKKILIFLLTEGYRNDNILPVADTVRRQELNMQRYRSGHNEAVLKTVCPQGRVGSNPTLCVLKSNRFSDCFFIYVYHCTG